ncbi:hypothetical protein SAY86_015258 [Trapa natans]|uniref:Uncharacterized protein n=1 Tax=Trapa natans TaxID=22666 RepID=A0AAN7QHQ1_TRANT|nr:hypothetical protein SAY86_015258 [Trapa natans]
MARLEHYFRKRHLESACSSAAAHAACSARYQFPVGLLPEGITKYSLDEGSGRFSTQLNGTCSFELEEKYTIRYEPPVKGVIRRGKIDELEGVSVRIMGMVWLSVVQVVKVGHEIEFSVGVASAGFPAGNFAECHSCGFGIDCKDDATASSYTEAM